MANPLLQQYIKVTEFLGLTLGPDYEVALHDMTDKNRSIIAIANNHISGRDVGAPLTNVALKILMDKSYETQDYRLHYCGMSAKGKVLRSSTMFIKQNGKLIGMLCRQLLDRTPAVCGAERTGKPFECCISTGLCRKSAEQFVLIHSRPVLSHKKLFHDSICRREEKCVHRGINCG